MRAPMAEVRAHRVGNAWSSEAADAFIERARQVFPGSCEVPDVLPNNKGIKGNHPGELRLVRRPEFEAPLHVVRERATAETEQSRSPAVTRGTASTDDTPSSVTALRTSCYVPFVPLVTGGPEAPEAPVPLVTTERTETGLRLNWQREHLDAIERHWSVDDEGRFPCPLPGHSGSSAIDTAPGEDEREPRLLCCRGRWRSLGETWAAIAYGKDAIRSSIEIATWNRRLAFDLGAFDPYPIVLPELPPDATDEARRARDGFALLVGLRWADPEHRRPVAWSVRFAAAWCGLRFRAAHDATRTLVDAEVIAQADRAGRVRLFVPGGML